MSQASKLLLASVLALCAQEAQGQTPVFICGGANPPAQCNSTSAPGHALSAASNNSTLIKGATGTLTSLTISVTGATLGYFRLYDSAVAPTCSSATGVVWGVALPPVASAQGPINITFPSGMKFVNGIGFCATGAIADNDNTNYVVGTTFGWTFQ